MNTSTNPHLTPPGESNTMTSIPSPPGDSGSGNSSPTFNEAPSNIDDKQPKSADDSNNTELNTGEKPFSIYTKREKWYMVGMAAFAGLFSPLTSTVYFPAIPTMANAFGKSVELINLTVTIYMVFQGISPMLWGSLADRFGRRPVYLMCLCVLILSCIGLALVPTNAYWLLMLLRCFQAAGSASTIALGAGVISDIATPEERGGFLGLFSLGPLLGPCIGPIIGGLLAGNLGWRSMFWFLAIVTGLMLIFMGLTFPETLRAIVGDGTKPPQKWNRTPILILGRKDKKISSIDPQPTPSAPRRHGSPLHIFRVFTQPDILLMLVSTGIIYSLFYSVTTTTSPLFLSVYPYLTQSTVGLCFIAYGAGGALGSVIMGRVLDHDWKQMQANYTSAAPDSKRGEGQPHSQAEKGAHTGDQAAQSGTESRPQKVDKQDFPIEHTRLKRAPILFVVEMGACIGYGWSIQARAHLAVSLVLQFIVGLVSMGVMTINQTILVDMYPAQGSSITAANNLVRCLLGAGTISIQDFVINAINPGWTYVVFCGVCLFTIPMFMVEWRYGAMWRKKRANAAKKN